MEILRVRKVLNCERYRGYQWQWVKTREWSLGPLEKVARMVRETIVKRGEIVLIKAVAQAIPSFTMSCFILPEVLVHELNMMIS